ncbi:MAG: hypothetical protein HC857_00530 [Synechococcales cyanobacterium RU_4_20]|nr:hypothetical protein [Synechococcales cyanobacterium RU_4_20]
MPRTTTKAKIRSGVTPVRLSRPALGRLTPEIERLYQAFFTEISSNDPILVSEYLDALSCCPPLKASYRVMVLMCLSSLGEYTHPDVKIQDWVRLNFEQMRGSFAVCVGQLLSAIAVGYSVAEISWRTQGKDWMLASLTILPPERYRFRGRLGSLESILYRASIGKDIEIPLEKIVHIVTNEELAFNDPCGISDLRPAIAAFKAWRLIVKELVVAAKRNATGLLVGEYDPMVGGIPALDEQGNPRTKDGEPILLDPATELGNTLAIADSSHYVVVPTGTNVQQIAIQSGVPDILEALRYLHKLLFLSLLFPETALEVVGTGTGDSNLNKGQMGLLRSSLDSLMDQIKEKLLEQVVRPVVFWKFGEQDNWGAFTAPEPTPENKLELFNAIVSAFTQGFFAFDDLEAQNLARDLLGLSPKEEKDLEKAQPEEAPPEEEPTPEEETEMAALRAGIEYWLTATKPQTFATGTSDPVANLPAVSVAELLLEILQESYSDPIETLDSWKLEGDTFAGEFSDQISLSQVKRYRFEISPTAVQFRALNPDEIAEFGIEFAAKAKGKKKRNCPKGTPCGGSCISAKKTCRKGMSAKQLAAHKKALKLARQQRNKEEAAYHEFEEAFKKAYFEERRQQELRGVVAVLGNEIAEKVRQQHSLSNEKAEEYYDRLKSSGNLVVQRERGNELIQWSEAGNATASTLRARSKEKKKAIAREDAAAKELATAEDQLLGRKPTKIGSLASYKTKAKKWARDTFGDDTGTGANGFTLEQTQAHDVAHPITHEMLGSDGPGINTRLGALRQKDGKPSLLGEEAIVNVVEHLSRGDSIEASILNGIRLARVLSRNQFEAEEARTYVRSREFKNELAKMAHELYQHDNFSLYMDHVRVTNRISQTVTVNDSR